MIEARRVPAATYRLQLNRFFTFKDAARIVPYLHDLGISDLYASPFLKAGPDSLHGYDVSNHHEINPAIGSPDDYEALSEALRERGMSQLLDIVPNHMGVGTSHNTWWNDVLENGPISVYAPYFDIDWSPLQEELRDKVLLPILGDQYGRVLENGELRLTFRDGAFFLEYYEHILPIAPESYAQILAGPCERLASHRAPDDPELVELQSILTAISHLPTHDQRAPEQVAEHNREKEVVKRRLAALIQADQEILDEIDMAVGRFNGRVGDSRSFDALDAILNWQAYRLAFWRVASEEINYRRFFDVNTLAALRIENPDVFAATHRLIFDLVRRGHAAGLRVDHPDGLLDPAGYFERLQAELLDHGPDAAPDIETGSRANGIEDRAPRLATDEVGPLYVVVEKILAKDEPLPATWAVHGTTGYDFLNEVGGLFVDGSQRRRFDEIYARFIGRRIDFHELVYESKRRIMALSLASEINVLAWQINNLSERDRRFRDFTLYALRDAVREVIACFPVYRTYITGRPVSETDRAQIEIAIAWARRRNPAGETSIFQFVRDVLLLEAMDPEDFVGQRLQLQFVQKLQQTSGPVMAKAVEDTAFYIYNRLASLNEVGGEPEAFGVSVPAFHRSNAERVERWPHTLLSTSTHDTKRSEDVRARISVLSELPPDWAAALTRWARANRRHKTYVDGDRAPSRNDEYLLYQVVVGAWPLEGIADEAAREAFVGRIQEYMAKATKEAKVHTSWINPNEGYDAATRDFIAAILDPRRSSQFLGDFERFQRRVARVGAVNSLAQTVVKLTVPGVPDIYQGNELWDFSLVDPDNRRPVDYKLRQRHLASLQRALTRGEEARAPVAAAVVVGQRPDGVGAPDPAVAASQRQADALRRLAVRLRDDWTDGRVKQFVTWRTLGLRRRQPDLFRSGAYLPVQASGRGEEHLIAFAREHADQQLLVVAPRLVARLLEPVGDGDEHAPLRYGAHAWDDTMLLLPDRPGQRYRDLFTGERVETVSARGGTLRGARSALPLATLFGSFPVILLVRESP